MAGLLGAVLECLASTTWFTTSFSPLATCLFDPASQPASRARLHFLSRVSFDSQSASTAVPERRANGRAGEPMESSWRTQKRLLVVCKMRSACKPEKPYVRLMTEFACACRRTDWRCLHGGEIVRFDRRPSFCRIAVGSHGRRVFGLIIVLFAKR